MRVRVCAFESVGGWCILARKALAVQAAAFAQSSSPGSLIK